MRPKIWVAARLVVGLGVLALIARKAGLSELGWSWEPRLVRSAGLASLLLVLALGLSAVRWRIVLGWRGAPPLGALWRYYLIGWFVGLFLPTSIGGDAARAVMVARRQVRAGEAVSSVVVERAFGMVALLLFLVLGSAVSPQLGDAWMRSVDWGGFAWLIPVGAAGAGLILLGTARYGDRLVR
jgi:hypothetical protein